MKEKLINFETAKLAKEKGFDLDTFQYYHNKGRLHDTLNPKYEDGSSMPTGHSSSLNWNSLKKHYSAPTQSLLQKWLREVHGIIVQVVFSNVTSWDGNKLVHYIQIGVKRKESNFYDYIDRGYNKSIGSYDINSTPYPSWEEALERGLQEALLMIK
jgi:hypothetical protein